MKPDRLQQRLLDRIHRRYQTVTQRVDLGEVAFDFVRIADPDRVLDEVAEEEDRRQKASGRRLEEELHLPYWAELWDSAFGIGKFLINQVKKRCGPRADASVLGNVLDLGCGMGLAGTIAAAMGGRVLFADIETAALLFAALNSFPWRQRVRTRRTNWRTDDLGEKFDWIIGADIVYERAQWPYLESFWRRHLAEGGRVLLGEPGRQTGDLFVDWIAEREWILERWEEAVPTRPQAIRVFELRRLR